MRITRLIFASTLLIACNAWADLEILQKGIQLEPANKPPALEIGSVWNGMIDGEPYAVTYISETDSSETWKDSTGCTWTTLKNQSYAPSTSWANCRGDDGSATVTFKGGSIYPLQVGNKWSFYVNAGNWQTNTDCEVEDAVRVKTGAGEHDTFKIVCTDKWNTLTRYYSPNLETSVYTERHRRTKNQRIKYEFVKKG